MSSRLPLPIEGAEPATAFVNQDEKALLSDLACMLLSNMSKLDTVSLQILNLRVPFSVAPSPSSSSAAAKDDEHVEKAARTSPATEDEILALDLLLEVHLRGEGKKYNPNANYDFLASVFANISLVSLRHLVQHCSPPLGSPGMLNFSLFAPPQFPQGRAFLLAAPDASVEPPLSKLISFTEHPSPIRRGGVASTIKLVHSHCLAFARWRSSPSRSPDSSLLDSQERCVREIWTHEIGRGEE